MYGTRSFGSLQWHDIIFLSDENHYRRFKREREREIRFGKKKKNALKTRGVFLVAVVVVVVFALEARTTGANFGREKERKKEREGGLDW